MNMLHVHVVSKGLGDAVVSLDRCCVVDSMPRMHAWDLSHTQLLSCSLMPQASCFVWALFSLQRAPAVQVRRQSTLR